VATPGLVLSTADSKICTLCMGSATAAGSSGAAIELGHPNVDGLSLAGFKEVRLLPSALERPAGLRTVPGRHPVVGGWVAFPADVRQKRWGVFGAVQGVTRGIPVGFRRGGL